ncbi:MAG: hypothetical protein H6657_15625 [Ardenticatenaceae bacterium]|nr:hypothetical protein [Anaerolineales bacterium]MCB8978846.1 hypothetical protein [Ardenticatenaceae bacterium]
MFFQEAAETVVQASPLQIWGAAGFGFIIGWLVYYINRYRTGDVQFSDLATVIGIIGGGAILALFPAKTDLFGGYGLGLFAGFLSYFLVLNLQVARSKKFFVEWFLDGRSKKLADDEMSRNESAELGGGGTAMGADHTNSGGRE